jgi:hypothetical protein
MTNRLSWSSTTSQRRPRSCVCEGRERVDGEARARVGSDANEKAARRRRLLSARACAPTRTRPSHACSRAQDTHMPARPCGAGLELGRTLHTQGRVRTGRPGTTRARSKKKKARHFRCPIESTRRAGHPHAHQFTPTRTNTAAPPASMAFSLGGRFLAQSTVFRMGSFTRLATSSAATPEGPPPPARGGARSSSV